MVTMIDYPAVPELGEGEAVEIPEECAMCGDDYDGGVLGCCRVCAARMPRIGGCGYGLLLTVTAQENTPVALNHLADCPACRDWFDGIGEIARVADMERTYAGSLQATA